MTGTETSYPTGLPDTTQVAGGVDPTPLPAVTPKDSILRAGDNATTAGDHLGVQHAESRFAALPAGPVPARKGTPHTITETPRNGTTDLADYSTTCRDAGD